MDEDGSNPAEPLSPCESSPPLRNTAQDGSTAAPSMSPHHDAKSDPDVTRSLDTRGLIGRVSNKWQTEKPEDSAYDAAYRPSDAGERVFAFCDLEDDNSCPNTAAHLISTRRFRRMLAVLLFLALAFYYLWSYFAAPRLAEEWAYREGFVSQENGTYGIAKGGHKDKDLVRIKYLDHSLLPGGEHDPNGERRIVFIGDIHGCKKELLKLLKKVEFNEDTDHLVLVGDTVSKGPDNLGVLDELIRLNATSVRGNHEDRLLHVAKKLHVTDSNSATQPAPIEATSSKGFAKDAALVKQLKPRHLQYLRDMPLMLHIPALPMAKKSNRKPNSPITEHILVVHAGLVPGVRLAKQDPYWVMNMRSINRRTHVPSALHAGKNTQPWYDIWSWYNNKVFQGSSIADLAEDDPLIPEDSDPEPVQHGLWKSFFGKKKKSRPQVVIYGHDSKTGLVIKRWSKGLDSGCVGGGRLTALVLDAKGKQELTHVGCRNYRD